MKIHKLFIVSLIYIGLAHQSVHGQAIDYAATAQIDAGVALGSGLAVPTGSLMSFGYYQTALSSPLINVTQMSDILNPGGSNPFSTIFTGTMGLDNGAGGFFAGLFAAGIQSTLTNPVGQQFYFIIGNSSVALSSATQAGVFTAPSWTIPALAAPVPTLFATDINEVPRNSTGILFGSQGIGASVAGIAGADPALPNYNLSTVPEPSTYTLLAMGGLALAGYVIRRHRRV